MIARQAVLRTLDEEDPDGEIIRPVLDAARRYLDMDVAFLGQLTDEFEIFRDVVGDASSFGLTEGAAVARSETYCDAMVTGRMGRVIPDSTAEPALANLEAAASGLVGRYVGVPVHLPDGRLYGALCGIGHGADHSLGPRDARFLEFLATVVEAELGRGHEASQRQLTLASRVRPCLDGSGLTMVFQPIVELAGGTVVGYEALARFSAEPRRPPDVWFAEAAEAGLGLELELTAVKAALTALDQVPRSAYLSVNVSAETACSPLLVDALAEVEPSRMVLEITEHVAVANYEILTAALRPLRAQGVRLAVDDAGAGVASFDHILKLAPELLKLDICLTRGIDTSVPQAALTTALVHFGAATGAATLAEGIETDAELDALRRLGVSCGQGYLLGRPGPLPATGRWMAPGSWVLGTGSRAEPAGDPRGSDRPAQPTGPPPGSRSIAELH